MYTLADRSEIISELYRNARPKEFVIHDIPLLLSRDTLVPHPDTFSLITLASTVVHTHPEISSIADAGTGSGVIAIALAKQFPDLKIYASDKSSGALRLAQMNAEQNAISSIIFKQNTDNTWLSEFTGSSIDMIISNPPFVGQEEYASPLFQKNYPEVQKEPYSAIVTRDRTGIEPYEGIIHAGKALKTRFFVFQCNSLTINAITSLAQKEFPDGKIHIDENSAHESRFLTIQV